MFAIFDSDLGCPTFPVPHCKLDIVKCCFILRYPSSNADEYKRQGVELIGWGSKTRTGVLSSTLKRVTILVFSMRYL